MGRNTNSVATERMKLQSRRYNIKERSTVCKVVKKDTKRTLMSEYEKRYGAKLSAEFLDRNKNPEKSTQNQNKALEKIPAVYEKPDDSNIS